MRVLVIEDQPHLRRAVVNGLTAEGFAVDGTGDGEEGLWYLSNNSYDAVVMDLGLPGLAGDEILRRYRAAKGKAPVLVLTARDAVQERVRLLDLGADDYLVKPFAAEELLARVRALMRRGHQVHDSSVELGTVRIDLAAKRVLIAGQEVPLAPREYALVEYLALNVGRVVSRTELWEHLYDFQAEATSNVIDATVANTRKKLAVHGAGELIATRRGLGYEITAP